jgi:2-polyprenyl-3-methyl-5-hydroxy-6-metoxy-1,4-benzoquinol methylase
VHDASTPRKRDHDEDFMSLRYQLKVRILKTRRGNLLWRHWRARRGDVVGSYSDLADHVRRFAPGNSFLDIGCMWGVNGELAFLAEESGARAVKGVDVFGPTPEFEHTRLERNSAVEFVLGDCTQPETIRRVGATDVVLCAGVLYHHPAPFDLLVALRALCRKTLILRTSTIPEMPGLPNAAVFYPMLSAEHRSLWNLSSLGLLDQVGISSAFEPHRGYGNWFWGLTPSALRSLVETAGFRVDHVATEAFAQTLLCTPVESAFRHELPNPVQAQQLGAEVSAAGIARPA